MIDLAILGVLKEHDLHGYELKKRLAGLLGARSTVSFGSLYPALARLERAGFVKAVEHNTAPLPTPSSGSLVGELAAFRARVREVRGSRGKKVYGLTERGAQRLHELLCDADVADDREFAVRVALCRHLERPERLALFERRRDELARRLTERDEPQGGRLDTYLRSLLEHDTRSISNDIAWLDELVAAERAHLQEDT